MTLTDALSCRESDCIYRVLACGPFKDSFWPSLTDAMQEAARVGLAMGQAVTVEKTTVFVDYGSMSQPMPERWYPVRRVSVEVEKDITIT